MSRELSGVTRRGFMSAASAAGAAAILPLSHGTSEAAQAKTWQIGCHSRPFGSFRAAQAGNPDYVLDSVKAAGYQYADMIAAAPPGASLVGVSVPRASLSGPRAGTIATSIAAAVSTGGRHDLSSHAW